MMACRLRIRVDETDIFVSELTKERLRPVW